MTKVSTPSTNPAKPASSSSTTSSSWIPPTLMVTSTIGVALTFSQAEAKEEWRRFLLLWSAFYGLWSVYLNLSRRLPGDKGWVSMGLTFLGALLMDTTGLVLRVGLFVVILNFGIAAVMVWYFATHKVGRRMKQSTARVYLYRVYVTLQTALWAYAWWQVRQLV